MNPRLPIRRLEIGVMRLAGELQCVLKIAIACCRIA